MACARGQQQFKNNCGSDGGRIVDSKCDGKCHTYDFTVSQLQNMAFVYEDNVMKDDKAVVCLKQKAKGSIADYISG